MKSGPVHEVRKASHCAWQIHYHVVFPVKYRKTLLDEEVVQIIIETAQGISARYDMEFEQIGCDGNHIHLLCSAHPKIAPGQIVRVFKSITAREIFRRKPSVKKVLWGGQFWTDGYYVATVGEGGGWAVVERYVRNQGKPREDLRQFKLF
jgi:putative transposase